MALILKHAWDGYMYLFEVVVDPRTAHWPLVAKPYQVLTILTLYLLFVLKWGPRWMQNRRPFNLDKIMIAYNAFQVIICTCLVIKALDLAWLKDYKWICEPVDFTYTPKAIEITQTVYLFYLLKISDLLDTDPGSSGQEGCTLMNATATDSQIAQTLTERIRRTAYYKFK